jgi:hypothetical protein
LRRDGRHLGGGRLPPRRRRSLITKDLAVFMANAALKNSIADHGERPKGAVALSCKDDTFTTTCHARRQACK